MRQSPVFRTQTHFDPCDYSHREQSTWL
jgi:hypothetical protein